MNKSHDHGKSVQHSHEPLKLRMSDADDIVVVSAAMQDALVMLKDIAYHPTDNRFILAAQRFKWESCAGHSEKEHIKHTNSAYCRTWTGLHFNFVTSVQQIGLQKSKPDMLLNLLAISFHPKDDANDQIVLEFSAGAAIRVNVKCIEGYLSDFGHEWHTKSRPEHRPIDDK